jgi:threonine dehydrogenase-like Zn-dependent dehydrogenase
MRALVWHGPRDLRVEQLPQPEAGEGEVLVRVAGCGVCGSDMHGYLGHSRARVPPLVLGHEVSGHLVGGDGDGRLVAVRPTLTCGECAACRAGRDNICSRRRLLGLNAPGGLAEYVSVPAGNAVAVEASAPAQAAMVEVLANAVHVLNRAGDVDSLAIAGGGSLGIAIVLVAARRDVAIRLLSEPDPTRRAAAEQLGATATVDPRERPLAELAVELGGVEAAVDAVGSGPARRDAIAAVRAGGTVIALGLEEELGQIDFADLIRREIDVRGSFAYTTAEFAEAAGLYPQVAAQLAPLIALEPLDRGPEVFSRLASREDTRPKIVLAP